MTFIPPSLRPLTVGLLWHATNSSNYGVGALTQAHLELLRRIAGEIGSEMTFEMAGWSDPMPTYVDVENVTFHPFSRAFLTGRRNGLFEMARRCDLVLDIAGGDSFTDQYGMKRFWYQILSKAAVLAAGTPLVLAPQTIGPFNRPLARTLARQLMRRASAVVARDAMSSDFVRQLDPAIPLIEATDVAFGLDYRHLPRPPGEKHRIGLNVSGLLFGGGYTRRNEFGLGVDYPALVRTLIRRFLARGDCEVHLFSHVVVPRRFEGVVEDDHRVAEAIATEFEGVIVEPDHGSPAATKAQIATMDFFVGSRMHACVAAFSAGVPTVPIAYSRKFLGLFGTLGYDMVADPRTEDVETIVAKIEDGFARRQELANRVAAANAEAKQRLATYEALVRDLLLKEAGADRVSLAAVA